MHRRCLIKHRYFGSVIFAFKTTLTTTLIILLVLILLDKVLKKTLFAINALFTKDNNLSKTKVGGAIGQHCVGPKISFTDEMFGSNLFLSD